MAGEDVARRYGCGPQSCPRANMHPDRRDCGAERAERLLDGAFVDGGFTLPGCDNGRKKLRLLSNLQQRFLQEF